MESGMIASASDYPPGLMSLVWPGLAAFRASRVFFGAVT